VKRDCGRVPVNQTLPVCAGNPTRAGNPHRHKQRRTTANSKKILGEILRSEGQVRAGIHDRVCGFTRG
jgi:hypothetical protein